MERPWNRTVIRSKPRWALLLREQVVAAATLARAALATGTATRPRFVVQSLGRSGSTLLTDLLAIGLLIPWTRSWFRSGLAAYFKSHWTIQSFRSNGSPSTSTSHHVEVIDSYVVPPGGEKPDAS